MSKTVIGILLCNHCETLSNENYTLKKAYIGEEQLSQLVTLRTIIVSAV